MYIVANPSRGCKKPRGGSCVYRPRETGYPVQRAPFAEQVYFLRVYLKTGNMTNSEGFFA